MKPLAKVGINLARGVGSLLVAGLHKDTGNIFKGITYRKTNFLHEERIEFFKYLKDSNIESMAKKVLKERGIKIIKKDPQLNKKDTDFILLEFFVISKEPGKQSLVDFKNSLITKNRESILDRYPFYFVLSKTISKKRVPPFNIKHALSITQHAIESSRYEFEFDWAITQNSGITNLTNSLTGLKKFNSSRTFNEYKSIIPREYKENTNKTTPPSSTVDMFKNFVFVRLFNDILTYKPNPEPDTSIILTSDKNKVKTFIKNLITEIVKCIKNNNFSNSGTVPNFSDSYSKFGIPSIANDTFDNLKISIHKDQDNKIFDIRLYHKDRYNTSSRVHTLVNIVKFDPTNKKSTFMVLNDANKVDSDTVSIPPTLDLNSYKDIAKFITKDAPAQSTYYGNLEILKTFNP